MAASTTDRITVDRLMSARDLVDRWRGLVSTRTLANWRSLSTGPRYVKIGGRIAYTLDSVQEWEESRTVNGTADYTKVKLP